MSGLPACGSCKRPIRWAVTGDAGARMPLDVEGLEPAAGLVAFRASTGRCRVLTEAEVKSGAPGRWIDSGEVTVHTSHFATCPGAGGHRGVSRAQGSLDLDGAA